MSLQVLQGKVQTVANQLLATNLNVFNQASAGTMVLGNLQTARDIVEQLSWGAISGLVSDRNAYAPAGTPAYHRVLAQNLTNQIQTAGKVGPLVVTSGMLAKLETNFAEIASVVSAQAAQGIIAKLIGAGIGAAYGAISGNSAAIRTQTSPVAPVAPQGSKYPTLRELVLTAALFGDQASSIKAWYMNGLQFAQFLAYDVIDNPVELFRIDTVQVHQDTQGRVFVVSDQVSVGDNIIGLTEAGVIVEQNSLVMASDTVLGGENIKHIMQGEFDYGLSVKGYRFKTSVMDGFAGIKSLPATEMTKAANWELVKATGTDNAPITTDGAVPNIVGGGQGGSTGVKKQQNAQPTIPIDLKQTAGVIMRLTGSSLTNTSQAGS